MEQNDRLKKRTLILRVYLIVAALFLVATVALCTWLLIDAYTPDGNDLSAALAPLVALLLLFICVPAGIAVQVVLFEIFVLVRYLLTDPCKRLRYTVFNIISAAVAVLLPLGVVLLNVKGLDDNGLVSLLSLAVWMALWAISRGIYRLVRTLEAKKNALFAQKSQQN